MSLVLSTSTKMNLSVTAEEHNVNNPPHVVTLCKVLEKVSKSLPDAGKKLTSAVI